MNIFQREAHKRFRIPVATVDSLPVAPVTMTNIDSDNVDANKNLFYSLVDSQVAAELIKNT